MSIHKRIRERRAELGLTMQELADRIGVTWQSVQRWEMDADKNGTAPSRSRVKKVAEQLKVSLEWLVTGNSANLQLNGKYVFIPRYRPELETGELKHHEEISLLNEDDDTYAYRVDYLAKKGLNARDCRVIMAPDEAMALGEQLLIDITDTIVQTGKIYALSTAGGMRVRRLFPRFDGMLVMRADDPNVPEEVAPPRAVTVLGRVVGFTG